MDPISLLSQLFKEFPGIGERQARRFVYFLLSKDPAYLERLSRALALAKESVHQCTACFRFFSGSQETCPACLNPNADRKTLLVVERDSDYEAVARSHTYKGLYFVLGGSVPILEKKPEEAVRLRELLRRVEELKQESLEEVIIACSLTPSGDHTDETVRLALKDSGIRISSLGRGLSTGTELEYSDSATIRYALESRQ